MEQATEEKLFSYLKFFPILEFGVYNHLNFTYMIAHCEFISFYSYF